MTDCGFALAADDLALPPGASARTSRIWLTLAGRRLLAFSQGPFRPYLHPVLTPGGVCVTAERPADHPHHAGLWIAAERVSWWADGGPGEEHTYNFYVDETFQGRAPGRIVGHPPVLVRAEPPHLARVEQRCDWIGPPEWGAPTGREVAREERTILIRPGNRAHVLEVASRIESIGGRLSIGPTRHAWFNARLADGIAANGASLTSGPAWRDLTGPAGGGLAAGIALVALDAEGERTDWLARTWGVITLQTCLRDAQVLASGERLDCRARYVVHDGPPDADSLTAVAAEGPIDE